MKHTDNLFLLGVFLAFFALSADCIAGTDSRYQSVARENTTGITIGGIHSSGMDMSRGYTEQNLDISLDTNLDVNLEYNLDNMNNLTYPPGYNPAGTGRNGFAADTTNHEQPESIKDMFAKLSKCSYSKKSCSMPAGWHELGEEEIRQQFGIEPELFDNGSGFHADIFQYKDGSYALGFEGTDSLRDMLTDIAQGLPVPVIAGQYSQAVRLAKEVSASVGQGNLVFTGHSLGGGLASLASIVTNRKAITFNAAGLNPSTVTMQMLPYLVKHDHSLQKIFALAGNWSKRNQLVTAYKVRGDELTFVQERLPGSAYALSLIMPNAVGRTIILENPEGVDWSPEHGIDAAINAQVK